jgi:hypothetical protein
MTPSLQTGTERKGSAALQFTQTSSSSPDVLSLDHRDQLVATLLRVGQLRSLGDDWNSYGSPAPTSSLISAVESFIIWTCERFAPFLPAPYANPVPGGGIKLNWSVGDHELELELGPVEDGHLGIEYLRASHGVPEDEGVVASAQELVAHLTWVIQG